MRKVILTILGHDRPGIVGTVTRVFFEQNCNIENVSQTILQTEFSGSFIVTLPTELLPDQLQKILVEELASMDMHVHIATLAAAGDAFQSKGSEPFVITTKGPDRKGLVAGISAVIARHGVNITNLKRKKSPRLQVRKTEHPEIRLVVLVILSAEMSLWLSAV